VDALEDEVMRQSILSLVLVMMNDAMNWLVVKVKD
jgi:hypothetical protein